MEDVEHSTFAPASIDCREHQNSFLRRTVRYRTGAAVLLPPGASCWEGLANQRSSGSASLRYEGRIILAPTVGNLSLKEAWCERMWSENRKKQNCV
jgi:hypothetical protein